MVYLKPVKRPTKIEAAKLALRETFPAAQHPYFADYLEQALNSLSDGSKQIYSICGQRFDTQAEAIFGYVLLNFAHATNVKMTAICLDSIYQDIGVGKSALKALVSLLGDMNYRILFTQVRQYNARMMHVVESIGFTKVGVKHHSGESADNNVYAIGLDDSVTVEDLKLEAAVIYDGFQDAE